MMPLLPLLTVTLLHTAPGDTLFVQASALNLRTQPKPSAKIRQQVPIGSACVVVSLPEEGWAELSCPQAKGFGKVELLGPQPPDYVKMLAQGLEPGRSLLDALSLLQRAVTLKPNDPSIQKAFQELFWRAEFNRLLHARATDMTLKKESSLPKGCGDMNSCLVAALAPDPKSKVTWTEAYVEGTDIVSGQLFADGLLYLRSGYFDTSKRTLTIQLESFMVPSETLLKGLGITGIKDACEPQAPRDNTELCGDDFEQSCGPDGCWDPYASCKQASATRCQECKLACKSPCEDCRMKCGTDNRQECVASCIEATRQCEAKCQAPVEAAYASCRASYESCSQEEEREWNLTCKAPCDQVVSCVERCQQKNPNTDVWTCVHQCDGQLPKKCDERCTIQFQ